MFGHVKIRITPSDSQLELNKNTCGICSAIAFNYTINNSLSFKQSLQHFTATKQIQAQNLKSC